MLRSVGKLKSVSQWTGFILGELVLSVFPSYALAAGARVLADNFQSTTLPFGGSIWELAMFAQMIDSATSSWFGWVALLLFLEVVYLFASWLDMKRFVIAPKSARIFLGLKGIYNLCGAIFNLTRSATRGLFSWYHGETRFTVVQQLDSSALRSILKRVMVQTGTGKNLAFVEYSPSEDGDYVKHADDFLKQYSLLLSGMEPRKVSTMMVRQNLDPDELVKRLQTSRPTIRLGVVDGRCAFLAWTMYDFSRRVRKTLFFLDSSDVASHLKAGLKALKDGEARGFGKSGA